MSTIRTSQRGPAGAGRFTAAAVGLIAGCVLVALSAPIVAGAAAALPGDLAARGLRQRADLGDEELLTLISSRSRAIERYGALDWRRELATASVVPRGGKVETAAVDRAMAQTRITLEQGPASPQDWLRLSILETMKGERAPAVRHLSTALLTGADMPRLRWGVLDVGFELWRDLPPETRLSALRALRNAWTGADRRERAALLGDMRDRGFLPLARMVLAQEEGLDEALTGLGIAGQGGSGAP
ncbi:MAG: hypothetical protein AB7O49_03945 [Sphingomonadales bacterium]